MKQVSIKSIKIVSSSTLKDLNKQFNAQYISRAQTTIKPGQIEEKRSMMRQAYEDLILDTISYSRIAGDKTLYLEIIDGLNGLIGDYNQSVTLRLSGRSTDTYKGDEVMENKEQE